ncbi:MAG: RraA family protein [Geminicoccaceae bacterium]
MSVDLLASLRAFDTPTICNALEIVAPARRASGFTSKPFVCAFPSLSPIVGYARTATIRAREKPVASAADMRATRLRYYDYIASAPAPAMVVIEDRDPEPGFGAFWGEVNTTIHKGLGLLGCITNGSIRDLDMIATDFQLLAGCVAPSHAWVHVEEIDVEVQVHGMTVRPGDLIHADKHGAVVVPGDAVADVLLAVDLVTRREAPILGVARQADFTIDKLKAAMAEADEIH